MSQVQSNRESVMKMKESAIFIAKVEPPRNYSMKMDLAQSK